MSKLMELQYKDIWDVVFKKTPLQYNFEGYYGKWRDYGK